MTAKGKLPGEFELIARYFAPLAASRGLALTVVPVLETVKWIRRRGWLDPADYERTVKVLLSGGSDPVISKEPEKRFIIFPKNWQVLSKSSGLMVLYITSTARWHLTMKEHPG